MDELVARKHSLSSTLEHANDALSATNTAIQTGTALYKYVSCCTQSSGTDAYNSLCSAANHRRELESRAARKSGSSALQNIDNAMGAINSAVNIGTTLYGYVFKFSLPSCTH